MSSGLSFPQPSGLVPGSNSLLETQMLGTTVAAVIYGFLFILFIDCFRLLLQKDAAIPSRRLHRFLIFFASLMLLLGTLSLIQGVLVSVTSIFGKKSFPSLSGGAPFVLPVSIWTADGFMLWRCAILYQGVSRSARLALLSFISLVFMAALGSGVSLFVNPLSGRLPTLLIVSSSTFFNIVICFLIVGRLVLHRRYLKSALGPGHGSPYTRIMAMTVESAALLIILGVPYVFLVAYQSPNGSMFVLQLLPQICAISPLLIIYRVAQGRAAMQMPVDGGPNHPDIEALGSLHFKTRTISLSSIESFCISDDTPSEPEKSLPLPS